MLRFSARGREGWENVRRKEGEGNRASKLAQLVQYEVSSRCLPHARHTHTHTCSFPLYLGNTHAKGVAGFRPRSRAYTQHATDCAGPTPVTFSYVDDDQSVGTPSPRRRGLNTHGPRTTKVLAGVYFSSRRHVLNCLSRQCTEKRDGCCAEGRNIAAKNTTWSSVDGVRSRKPDASQELKITTLQFEDNWKLDACKLATKNDQDHSGEVVRLLASNPDETGWIPGGVFPEFSHVGIVPDDATGQRVFFSGVSHFHRHFIPALLHPDLVSTSYPTKNWMLSSVQIFSLAHTGWTQEIPFSGRRPHGHSPTISTKLVEGYNDASVSPPHFISASDLGGCVGIDNLPFGATVAERLASSSPTKAGRVHSPVRSLPYFRVWESCRAMPLVGRVSRGISRFPSALTFRRCSVLISITHIGSQDLVVKSRPNIFTHSISRGTILASFLLCVRVSSGRMICPTLSQELGAVQRWDCSFSVIPVARRPYVHHVGCLYLTFTFELNPSSAESVSIDAAAGIDDITCWLPKGEILADFGAVLQWISLHNLHVPIVATLNHASFLVACEHISQCINMR
ncbi:hypothetical protein PR048_031621 [Dryococelus australis]|uniref:Uncharacterized protein n=1 Tax=Dryococelus australis TaxID=614101 RepID=A0ABQ9G5T6_9NEOP|nr:hypothetical protein PR048_031621 [Dryococelus australis]